MASSQILKTVMALQLPILINLTLNTIYNGKWKVRKWMNDVITRCWITSVNKFYMFYVNHCRNTEYCNGVDNVVCLTSWKVHTQLYSLLCVHNPSLLWVVPESFKIYFLVLNFNLKNGLAILLRLLWSFVFWMSWKGFTTEVIDRKSH